jgi:hypothetical protein
MAVPRLRDRLRAIIADFRTQTSLREGCNAVLRSDCRQLMARLRREARRAVPTVYVQQGGGTAAQGGGAWLRYQPGSRQPAAPVATAEVPDIGGGGGAAGGVCVGLPCRVREQLGDSSGGGADGSGGQAAQRRAAAAKQRSARALQARLPSLVS